MMLLGVHFIVLSTVLHTSSHRATPQRQPFTKMSPSAEPTNRALWLSSFDKPLELINLPVPEATAGSAVVQVLNTVVQPYAGDIHNGKLQVFNLFLPLVPHPSNIGRVHTVGSDAVLTKPGDLVYFMGTVYGRDDSETMIIQGHHGGEGRSEEHTS